jgi:hypothetical protein
MWYLVVWYIIATFRSILLIQCSILKNEAIGSSRMLIHLYQDTERHLIFKFAAITALDLTRRISCDTGSRLTDNCHLSSRISSTVFLALSVVLPVQVSFQEVVHYCSPTTIAERQDYCEQWIIFFLGTLEGIVEWLARLRHILDALETNLWQETGHPD